jgi:enoyl-CoA hydratase/carnithine racemase
MGLVNRVVPDGELEAYVRDLASGIAANAPLTVGSIKTLVGEAVKDAANIQSKQQKHQVRSNLRSLIFSNNNGVYCC